MQPSSSGGHSSNPRVVGMDLIMRTTVRSNNSGASGNSAGIMQYPAPQHHYPSFIDPGAPNNFSLIKEALT